MNLPVLEKQLVLGGLKDCERERFGTIAKLARDRETYPNEDAHDADASEIIVLAAEIIMLAARRKELTAEYEQEKHS